MNPCELPLDASLFQIMGQMMFFLEFSHTCGHEVVPSELRALELRESPMYIQ